MQIIPDAFQCPICFNDTEKEGHKYYLDFYCHHCNLYFRLCTNCFLVKPLNKFYAHKTGNKQRDRICIKCKRQKSIQIETIPRNISGVKTEKMVMQECHKRGIYSAPGKASAFYDKRPDVVAEGNVLIEVKKSHFTRSGYLFGFGSQLKSYGVLLTDLVVLILRMDNEKSFHVFPSKHPVFYHDNGQLKRGISYLPNPTHRKNVGGVRLTSDLMNYHKDAWYLIWEVKKQKEAIMLGENPELLSSLIYFHQLKLWE
jgi:hypothetical protein